MPKALYASTKSDKTAYNVSSFLGKHRLRRRKIGILSCFRVKCVVFFAFLAKAPLCSRTILSRIHLIFCFSTMRTFSSCYFFCFSHIFIISYCALFVHTSKKITKHKFQFRILGCLKIIICIFSINYISKPLEISETV